MLPGGSAFAQANKRAPTASAQKLEGAVARLSAIAASGRL
jgi:hypothetical protein